ncbi:MAG: dihydrofolate reductase, partial [Lactobacillus iners]|nr:dihydrofolate reductase [Lactobacillus iners]
MIVFIWAEDLAGNIGNKGKLPWHLPADLKHFKRLTENHTIVMGRKTFDSFPGLLKNRHHVILTTDAEFTNYYKDNDQITIFNSLTDLRKWLLNEQKTIYILGGFS